jgi:hypothetical protein
MDLNYSLLLLVRKSLRRFECNILMLILGKLKDPGKQLIFYCKGS